MASIFGAAVVRDILISRESRIMAVRWKLWGSGQNVVGSMRVIGIVVD
jgi:hypothetical protein